MSLIVLLIVLALLGVLAWALTTYIPMPRPIQGIIIIVVVIVAIVITLNAFRLMGAVHSALNTHTR